jgi:hypothetical protein
MAISGTMNICAGSERYDYGFLPPRFFDRVLKAFVACHRAGKTRRTPREP